MKKVCIGFGNSNPAASTATLLAPPISPDITFVARAFVDLQDARHEADYDTLASFSKPDVMSKIHEVEQSFVKMSLIRGDPNFNVFLSALLLQEVWRKRQT
jgi:hypothetical protein